MQACVLVHSGSSFPVLRPKLLRCPCLALVEFPLDIKWFNLFVAKLFPVLKLRSTKGQVWAEEPECGLGELRPGCVCTLCGQPGWGWARLSQNASSEREQESKGHDTKSPEMKIDPRMVRFSLILQLRNSSQRG